MRPLAVQQEARAGAGGALARQRLQAGGEIRGIADDALDAPVRRLDFAHVGAAGRDADPDRELARFEFGDHLARGAPNTAIRPSPVERSRRTR